MDILPKEGEEEVELGTSVVVVFDKDVRTLNINKLFEVRGGERERDALFLPLSLFYFPHSALSPLTLHSFLPSLQIGRAHV